LFDLLSGDGQVVASPRSFNNRAGLSRAINENLSDGTRVFIAEMGTYGPGEIADLCSWCAPEIAVITAIGPVHLERMKSLDVIESAKFEITQKAKTVIINTDDQRLKNWPAKLSGKKVRTAGSADLDASVRVSVEGPMWRIIIDGVELMTLSPLSGVQPSNLACAVACALEIGSSPEQLKQRISMVQSVANRANVITAQSGVMVIDDTFNANPASAQASLHVLASLALNGRRVVVTPGMIELGDDQFKENATLAKKIADVNAELVVVGRTNVRSLTAGYEKFPKRFDTRDQAVAWVREVLIAGDGVLYLNDLPDHYP
jgi:UDP-N-acetylmuramoyl-tripeptide--D-alanyl-D-alanine ligase